jgi:hypothetical protein
MERTPPKTLSEKLIDDLINKGILRVNHNRHAARQIIKRYFTQVFNQAVLDTRCACNKREFNNPQFTDI